MSVSVASAPLSISSTEIVIPSSSKIDVIQDLRGIAALSVCWFHYTYYNGMFQVPLSKHFLWGIGHEGWLGVQMFFVISGFILPYSLFKANYQLSFRNFGIYCWKRLSRLEPPYLISLALTLGVITSPFLLPWLTGSAPTFTAMQIFLHFGYLIPFFHQGWWLNPVYWTLGIEFQYYLLLGILYPLIASRKQWIRALGWAAITILALMDHFSSLGHVLFIFMLGFSVFQYRARIVGRGEFTCALAYAAIGCVTTLGKSVTLIGILTCVVMLFVGQSWSVTTFLGDLSYSLYLIHLPIGGLVFGFLAPLGGGLVMSLAAVATALAVSIAFAYVLSRSVEGPCRRYASTFRFQ